MLSPSATKVQEALRTAGFAIDVRELPETTRTAKEASQAIGCSVEQIAKSLIFRIKDTETPILAIASGGNRVDEQKIASLIGKEIDRADAEFVRSATGFVIGGVPPIGHKNAMQTIIDEDLFRHHEIWAAAGTPHAVFRLTPRDLQSMTNGIVASIALNSTR